jgi:hypothetical protein
MSWTKTHIDLGIIKPQTTHVLQFKWEGEVPEDLVVKSLIASCGCTTPVFSKAAGVLEATYKSGAIPNHLKAEGQYTTKKKVVMNTNHGEFTLSFGALIKQ